MATAAFANGETNTVYPYLSHVDATETMLSGETPDYSSGTDK